MSSFIAKLQKRLAKEESGFTLIELLIVLVIIGILLAIAVPSYLGFKDRANYKAAQADIRAAFPSAEAFYSDNGTYTGLTAAGLLAIDSGLSPAVGVTVIDLPTAGSGYCMFATVGGKSWSAKGPGANFINDGSATDTWYKDSTTCT